MPRDEYDDEDDRPRRPKNSRDDDEDDRPARRRRDEDDDYEDRPRRSGGAPHHGVAILILGIFGFCCGFAGLAAGIWGVIELGKMNKGQIDPSGRGLVTAGTIIGFIMFGLGIVSGIYFNMHPNMFK
jgi:hypothetical protein